jgi:hypothetical protein
MKKLLYMVFRILHGHHEYERALAAKSEDDQLSRASRLSNMIEDQG